MVLIQENHRFHTKKVIEVDSLHDEAFIMPKAGCDILVKKLLKERGGVKPHVLFEIEDNNTLISMVQEGLGVTIIPKLVLPPHIPHTKVIPLETSVFREVNLALKSFKAASPSAKRWIETVKNHFNRISLNRKSPFKLMFYKVNTPRIVMTAAPATLITGFDSFGMTVIRSMPGLPMASPWAMFRRVISC